MLEAACFFLGVAVLLLSVVSIKLFRRLHALDSIIQAAAERLAESFYE